MFARLAHALRAFRSRPVLLGAIFGTIWLPAGLATIFVESTPRLAFDGVELATGQVAALALLFAPLVTGALLSAVATIRAGGSPSYAAAFRVGAARWGKLLAARYAANLLVGLALLAFVVPGFVLLIRFSLIEACIVVEDAGVGESLRRSWRLTRGRSLDVLAVGFAVGLGGLLALFLVYGLLAALAPAATEGSAWPMWIFHGCLAFLAVVLLGIYTESAAPSAASPRPAPRRGRGYLALVPVFALLSLVPAFRAAVFDWNDVPTSSMVPSILPGDRIVVDKTAYGLRVPFTSRTAIPGDGPEPGDVVVLRSPEDGAKLVKRVVGLPGDVIAYRGDFRLRRNGPPVEYSRPESGGPESAGPLKTWTERIEGRGYPVRILAGAPQAPNEIPHGCVDGKRLDAGSREWQPSDSWVCVLGESEYFVLGDNRNNSRDSRTFGPVDRRAILGEATAVALSFDLKSHFAPRWERFFRRLR